MKISLIQTAPFWEQPEKNLELFSQKIEKIPENTNLVLLPEMFLTGFSMHPEKYAATIDGKALDWMRKLAGQKEAALAGSLMIQENGNYYNRFIFVKPDQSVVCYDKKHLFRMGNEHVNYTSGNERKIIELMGWRILPVICYDLRFPVWLRNTGDYDLLLVVANWPQARRDVWLTLLKARAIENMAYVAAVNRIGTDGRNIGYCGDSVIIDFKGNPIQEVTKNEEKIITKTLNKDKLVEFREKFPAHLDRDIFYIK